MCAGAKAGVPAHFWCIASRTPCFSKATGVTEIVARPSTFRRPSSERSYSEILSTESSVVGYVEFGFFF